MPHFFITDIGQKVSQLLLPHIILKIFFKCLTPRGQLKLVLTCSNLENILSNLALETETAKNSVSIESASILMLISFFEKINKVGLSSPPPIFWLNMLSFNFSEESGTSFSTTFCRWFFKKNVSPVIFYYLTNFHCLKIGQYVYYNCLLTVCDVISFDINLIFLFKPFCYITKKSRQKFKDLENKKSFLGEIKKHFFYYFERAFICQKLS